MIKRYGKMRRGGWTNIELIRDEKNNIEESENESEEELDPLENTILQQEQE